MNITPGITHCDTIGDIFKNPILMRFVSEWYVIKKDEKLRWKQNINEEIKFTPQYYEFIREVFEDRGSMEDFLAYMRERFLNSEALYQKVYGEYEYDDIIKFLLSCDELNHQLTRVDKLTIKGLFKTKIAEIMISAQSRPSYTIDSDDEQEDEHPRLPVYYALEGALDNGMMPISSSGEILCRIAEGNVGHIVSVLGEDRGVFEVDRIGDICDSGAPGITMRGEEVLTTRSEVVQRIKLLERVITYHHSADIELSEEDEQYYIDQRITFDSQHDNEKGGLSAEIKDIHFSMYLNHMKKDLEKALRKMLPSDTSQIESWEASGYKAGISTELPQYIEGSNLESIKRRPKLRVIS